MIKCEADKSVDASIVLCIFCCVSAALDAGLVCTEHGGVFSIIDCSLALVRHYLHQYQQQPHWTDNNQSTRSSHDDV